MNSEYVPVVLATGFSQDQIAVYPLVSVNATSDNCAIGIMFFLPQGTDPVSIEVNGVQPEMLWEETETVVTISAPTLQIEISYNGVQSDSYNLYYFNIDQSGAFLGVDVDLIDLSSVTPQTPRKTYTVVRKTLS